MLHYLIYITFGMIVCCTYGCQLHRPISGSILEALSYSPDVISTRDVSSISMRTEVIRLVTRINFRLPGHVVYSIGSNCSNIPSEKIFAKTSILILKQGSLKSIVSGDISRFSSTLEFADFSRNQISHISMAVFDDIRHLQEIDLSFNKIHSIGNSALHVPAEVTTHNFPLWKIAVSMKGNPLQCTCTLAIETHQRFHVLLAESTFCFVGSVNEEEEELENAGIPVAISELKSQGRKLIDFCQQEEGSLAVWFHNKHLKSPEDVGSKHNILASGQRPSEATDKYNPVPHSKLYRRHWSIDIPLLLTMAFWFVMVFVGLSKFVRSNALEYELHKEYLDKLDQQENEIVATKNNEEHYDIMKSPGRTLKRNVCSSLTSLNRMQQSSHL